MSDHPPNPLTEGEEAPPPGTRAMAMVRWAILGLVALAAGYTLVLAALGPSHLVSSHEEGHVELEQQQQAATPVTRFTCPMHPRIVSDKPGLCPICDMPLVLMAPEGESTALRDGHAHEAGQGG